MSRSNNALPAALGGSLALGWMLAAGVATAQPAPPPPATAKPPVPAAAPKAGDAPLLPPAPAAQPVAAPAPVSPDVDRDAKALAKQGAERPTGGGEIGAKPSDVYAEDWWSSARPVFEIHGYFRTRAELFHNFALGRLDSPGSPGSFWPQPPDNDFWEVGANGAGGIKHHVLQLCGADPLAVNKTAAACQNNTQAGANMRFRITPEIHISDNLRVMAQIDMLDNVVLGSTPEGYANQPTGTSSGYGPIGRGGYTPLGAFATTQWAPVANSNATQNSITVKRVWGEYMTPVGMLRFGRMPSQWGLGMVANSGDGYDSDYQSTADRIMFVTGLKKYDLYFAAMWDFANEGLTSAVPGQQQGQAYDLSQLDDVNQYGVVVVRRRNPELQKLDLAKGLPVFNGGVYFIYRNQFLANDSSNPLQGATLGQKSANYTQGFVRRNAQAYIPDLWLQFLYKKFRFEAEAAMIYGSMETTAFTGGSSDYVNPQDPKNKNGNAGWKIRQFGVATQSEFRAIEDRLRVQFGFGWASGDPDLDSLAPSAQGLSPQKTADRTYSQFAFHPDYRVDLILFRNILNRVQGAYYFKPSVEYDFTRDKNGQRLGGGAAVIWSRASEFIQTPGHARDLGIELNGKLYFQSKDGSLNDDPNKMGGFFTSLEYGVLFPLAGLGYMPGQVNTYATSYGNATGTKLETATAQTLRWYAGILF